MHIPLVTLELPLLSHNFDSFTYSKFPIAMEYPSRSFDQCVEMVSWWERECSVLHGHKCHLSISSTERPLGHSPDWPDWVIDTNQGCIVRGNSVDKYVALSYVWNSPGDSSGQATTNRLLLQRENLDHLQHPWFLLFDSVWKRLPKVIQQSMLLVFQSGARYLWVDCLCIVQNDEHTSAQVALLPRIYSGAFFTIIAAAEINGLLGSVAEVQNPGQENTVDNLHGRLLATRWATRGWTFQEHIFSKRSIVFLDTAIFWDCQCSVWWSKNQTSLQVETDCESQGITPRFDEETQDTEGSLPRRLTSCFAPDLDLYRELVCRYNHRDLTEPQDAIPAFSGVLDVFTQFFHGDFISGLPELILDSVLLWQPFRKAKRRIAAPSAQCLAPESPLPSWSWIGWQCLVDPRSLRSDLNSQADKLFCHYSSPINDNVSINTGPRSTTFLSKTTTCAKLRVRRLLVPCSRIEPRAGYQSVLSRSIFDTYLYKTEPEVTTLCPVATLEDHRGRWAGVMRVMDDDTIVGSAQAIELVAISRGSCSYWDAALTYEATVDRLGCYKFDPLNGDHYHFECPDSGPLDAEACKKISDGSKWETRQPIPITPSPVFFENRLFGRDQGPLFPLDEYDSHSGHEEELPEAWHDILYEFYNVLWVETRGNVKYRKAAGWVSKDIWEETCGALETIVLG